MVMAPKTKIFVGHLPETCSKGELENLFSKFGVVTECDIIKNYAFVHMSTEEEAQAAIEGLNEYELNGSKISVEQSTSSGRMSGGRGRGSRGRGRGGGSRMMSRFPMRGPPSLPPGPPMFRDRFFNSGMRDRMRPYPDPYGRPLPPPMPPSRLYERRSPFGGGGRMLGSDFGDFNSRPSNGGPGYMFNSYDNYYSYPGSRNR